MILGHNVEYTGPMSRLPGLVLDCSKGGHVEGWPCQTGLKSGFLRGKKWMKWPEIFMGQSQPPGQSFPHGCIPWVLWHHAQACKNSVSGVERLLGSAKQQKESDRVTI